MHVRTRSRRHVSVLSVDGEVYAIDSICYHAGGPLAVGDIEDVNGHPCVLCPWHHYKVRVRAWEGVCVCVRTCVCV